MVYTRGARMRLLAVLLLSFILLALGGILGYLGGHKTFDGGADLLDQALAAVTEMDGLNILVAKSSFLSLGSFCGAGGCVYDSTVVSGAIDNIKETITNAKDGIVNIKDIFGYALPGFYGLFVAITILGFLSWMCGVGCCSMTMGIFGALFLFLAWLLFAVFWSVGVFLDDTCVSLSEHYALDCMKVPGYTCPKSKLTDLFKCPDISKVSDPYSKAYSILDTATTNGAGSNSIGSTIYGVNKGYKVYLNAAAVTGTTKWNTASYGDTTKGYGSDLAPSVVSNEMGMEPYTTCIVGESFAGAITGKRSSTCITGASNTNQVGPQNDAMTTSWPSVFTTTGLTAFPGSVNPPWAAASDTGRTPGDVIGTCARACLNNTASSGIILDSLTNFGGNAMFRKFVYETFTSVYSEGNQGYASCSNRIKWQSNKDIVGDANYQNYTTWMTTYSSMVEGKTCVPPTGCIYTGADNIIPFDFTDSPPGGTVPGCYQAAAMASADVMFALSYIAGCQYVKSFAYLTAVKSTGACFSLGDGLVYLIMAQGLIGAAFFMVTVVGIMGYRRFDSDNYPENKIGDKESDDPYGAAGVDPDEDANDQPGVNAELKPGIEPSIPYAGDGPPPAANSRDTWV